MQEHQPWRARLPGAGSERRRMRSLKRHEAAAGDIGDAFDHTGAGPIDQQHFAHHAGRGARHQRGQGSDGGVFNAFGWDDEAQHGSSMTRELRKRRTVITLSQSMVALFGITANSSKRSNIRAYWHS